MKNFKILLTSFIAIGWVGCTERIKELPVTMEPTKVSSVDCEKSTRQTIYNNPFLFGGGGGGFGPYFMALIKTQQFDVALKFTSRTSKKRLGEQAILKLFKCLLVNYTLRQVSYRKDADTFFIRFTTMVYATSRYKDLKVDVEEDTCRLVIDKPDEFLK